MSNETLTPELLYKIDAYWRGLQEVHARRSLKIAAHDFYNACSLIIKRSEALCQN